MQLIPKHKQGMNSRAVCSNHTEVCRCREHRNLITASWLKNLLSPLILSLSQIQFLCTNKLIYSVSFISLYSSYSPLPPPPFAGPLWLECVVRCVGRIALEFLSCTTSISHLGWWMRRTSSSGGWKCPHIGSQRGLENNRTIPLRWDAEREQRFSKQGLEMCFRAAYA